LGIAEESMRKAVTVDYSEETQRDYWKPYLQLGRHIVAHDINHHILGRASSVDRPADLPTWCPNLNSPYPERHPFIEVTGFKAGWSDSRPPQQNVSFAPDSSNIKIPGFVIDYIEALVDLDSPLEAIYGKMELGPEGSIAEWLAREERCFELARNACHDSDKALQAHVRTLITDTWGQKSPISDNEWPIVTQAYHDLLEISMR
jgi:hypothetical protein